MDGIGAAASTGALLSLIGGLIQLLVSLQGCGPKCAALLDSIRTLKSVLERVQSEYRKTMDLIAELNEHSSSLSIASDMLDRCIDDCSTTCRDFDVILRKISKSFIRGIKWKLAQDDLRDLGSRLEGNKSTLLLLLASISEERERCVAAQKLRSQPPPAYSSSPAPYHASESMAPGKKEGIRNMAGAGALMGTGVAALCLTNPIGWAGLAIAGGVSASWGLLGYVAFDNE